MVHRPLGRTGLLVSPMGFGAFKIGRNEQIKYAHGYELPDDAAAERLLRGVVDLGVNLIDTAPAYGLSEERVGRTLGARNGIVISTKVGETFENGRSSFDYSEHGVRQSIERSRQRLQRPRLDLVFIHSDGNDTAVLNDTAVVDALQALRREGVVSAIGFSGKTIDGARDALAWADAIMVEYHVNDASHANVIEEAGARGVAVIVKKGLASGRLPPHVAIGFVLRNPNVTSMLIGGLDLDHMRANVRSAEEILTS